MRIYEQYKILIKYISYICYLKVFNPFHFVLSLCEKTLKRWKDSTPSGQVIVVTVLVHCQLWGNTARIIKTTLEKCFLCTTYIVIYLTCTNLQQHNNVLAVTYCVRLSFKRIIIFAHNLLAIICFGLYFGTT